MAIQRSKNAELLGISTTDNEAQRNRIRGDPDRFLLIPGLSHTDHHDVLRLFLASNWTDDDRRRKIAQDAYTGSIGRWKKAVADSDIVRAYQQFRDAKIAELAKDFLLENNVEFEWR